MKHSYYYVVAGAMCDYTTLLYKVSIGMSLQGRRDYEFLKSYALQHNHYFCVLSAESEIKSQSSRSLICKAVHV